MIESHAAGTFAKDRPNGTSACTAEQRTYHGFALSCACATVCPDLKDLAIVLTQPHRYHMACPVHKLHRVAAAQAGAHAQQAPDSARDLPYSHAAPQGRVPGACGPAASVDARPQRFTSCKTRTLVQSPKYSNDSTNRCHHTRGSRTSTACRLELACACRGESALRCCGCIGS